MIVLEGILGLAFGIGAGLFIIWILRGVRAGGRAVRNTVIGAAYGEAAKQELIAKQARKPQYHPWRLGPAPRPISAAEAERLDHERAIAAGKRYMERLEREKRERKRP